MQASIALAGARKRAGLTQRELAARAGVPNSSVARIEAGTVVPRVDTLDRLLRICGENLEVRPRKGVGEDASLIREQLRRTPAQRLAYMAGGASNTRPLIGAFWTKRLPD